MILHYLPSYFKVLTMDKSCYINSHKKILITLTLRKVIKVNKYVAIKTVPTCISIYQFLYLLLKKNTSIYKEYTTI